MARDWIERRSAALLGQAQAFSRIISTEHELYEISPADAALLADDFAAFESAHRAVVNPARRTTVAVFRQRLARKALVARMREIGGRVRANPDVPPPQKLALGLPVRRSRDGGLLAPIELADGEEIPVRGSGRIGPPRTRPIVFLKPGSGGGGAGGARMDGETIRFGLADQTSPNRRTRPSWTLGAGVWFSIGRHASPDLQDWRFVRLFTRASARFTIPARTLSRFAAAAGASPGETVALNVWIAACWISPTGEPGAASTPVSVTVLAQADLATAAKDETPAAPRVAA